MRVGTWWGECHMNLWTNPWRGLAGPGYLFFRERKWLAQGHTSGNQTGGSIYLPVGTLDGQKWGAILDSAAWGLCHWHAFQRLRKGVDCPDRSPAWTSAHHEPRMLSWEKTQRHHSCRRVFGYHSTWGWWDSFLPSLLSAQRCGSFCDKLSASCSPQSGCLSFSLVFHTAPLLNRSVEVETHCLCRSILQRFLPSLHLAKRMHTSEPKPQMSPSKPTPCLPALWPLRTRPWLTDEVTAFLDPLPLMWPCLGTFSHGVPVFLSSASCILYLDVTATKIIEGISEHGINHATNQRMLGKYYEYKEV